jgi:hypothetical protein
MYPEMANERRDKSTQKRLGRKVSWNSSELAFATMNLDIGNFLEIPALDNSLE